MQQVARFCRYLLALALAVFGADKFLHFMPMPEPPPEGGAFLGALMDTGYIFPAIGVVFLAAAVLLVSNRVVLALLLLAPITYNILMYHVKFDMPGIVAGAVLTLLQVVLYMGYAREIGALLRGARPRGEA